MNRDVTVHVGECKNLSVYFFSPFFGARGKDQIQLDVAMQKGVVALKKKKWLDVVTMRNCFSFTLNVFFFFVLCFRLRTDRLRCLKMGRSQRDVHEDTPPNF